MSVDRSNDPGTVSRVEFETEDPVPEPSPQPSKFQSITIIFVVSGATFVNSMVNGLLIVGLPTMARDLGLARNLTFWPSSVFSLACGCCLLLSGSISDIFGSRAVFLLGSLIYTLFTLVCGFSKDGVQLILFRAVQGVSLAMCLPSAVSILANSLKEGRWRNMGFGALGAGQPIGFACGLVVSGVLLDSLSWRYAFYIASIINAIITIGAFMALPKFLDKRNISWVLLRNIDWLGAGLSSASLGLLSYTMAIAGQEGAEWTHLSLLLPAILSTLLALLFLYWVFSAICAIVFLTWAAYNSAAVLLTLVFQDVQFLPASQTSLRFIPDVVTGVIVNFGVGYLVGKTSTYWLILISTVVTLTVPILLARMDETKSYWVAAFPAMCLVTLSADVLYTVSNLVISNAFPASTQGLAGGVFNTIVQIANSVGLGITSIVASTVTKSQSGDVKQTTALMSGYHAGFWVCFGSMAMASIISGTSLTKIGRVGRKRD